MVKTINFKQYKKLKKLELNFKTGLNAISGTNGTCKSSLLYLISNSFQAVTTKCSWIKDGDSLKALKAVNSVTNPKVESLQRGDQQYNDPAHGVSGTLYTVDYYDAESLAFRRHISGEIGGNGRYALKPQYSSGADQKLPYCPVIYLGLPRLVPYGEFQNDSAIAVIKKNLPEQYLSTIAENFRRFTSYTITASTVQQMGDIKTRAEFKSDNEGIDSNTISAGEDNLYIILTALESLKYYYQSIESHNSVESVLLIDEYDATLHPAFQIKLLDLMRSYSSEYKIQIIFTTHSITTIENVIKRKDNLIYLIDNVTDIIQMETPSIEQIKEHLYMLTEEDIYRDKCIPVLTEDGEARVLLRMLFNHFEETCVEFRGISRFFEVPDINIGADILQGLFKDEKLIKSKVGAICILDGDKTTRIDDCIVALPGKNLGKSGTKFSPEELLFDYAFFLYDSDDNFWRNEEILRKGFSKHWYLEHVKNVIDDDNKKRDSDNKPAKKKREFNKKLFNDRKVFFEYVFKHWLHNSENTATINKFYYDLKKLFKKVAMVRDINPNEWKDAIS